MTVGMNDFTIGGGPGGGGCTSLLGQGPTQASPFGCVRESDVASEFNPNNLSHHAVFARGKNQPMVSSATTPSVYNPNWPKFTGDGTSVYVNTSAATVNLVGTTWPATVLPGWFLYIGSSAPAWQAPGTAGWYEVAAVNSATQLTLDRPAGTQSGQNFMLTAGLGNTFVPPWGPWSLLKCSDCHSSDDAAAPAGSADPFGPHGSGQKWLLTKYKPQTYPFYNGTGSTPGQVATVSNWIQGSFPSGRTFCLKCHRYEVYGDYGGSYGPPNPNFSRWSHPGDNAHYTVLPDWGIVCMHCHGGSRFGAIHGENVGIGHSTTNGDLSGLLTGQSYSGKRMLAGASVSGVTRPSTTTPGTCIIKRQADYVADCGYSHWRVGSYTASMGLANYDYESGPDPAP